MLAEVGVLLAFRLRIVLDVRRMQRREQLAEPRSALEHVRDGRLTA